MMFTDIEGSTELLEHLRERYALVLEQHRDIIRAALAQYDGFEVDTQGDSFFVAFSSPDRALACAIDIQRALAAHEWPDGTSVRIRIGLHAGEPAFADNHYVGIDVHRGARIGAAAHGGQVLLSEATASLLGGRLPAGVELTALGVFRFKGLAEPLPVRQVRAPGLLSDFPPIRLSAPEDEPPSPGEAPYNGLLRFEEADADRFFGREKLVAEVVASVRAQPFLAVVGASGSGKSSLVRAGIIPALKAPGKTRAWRTVVMSPTADPFAALALALDDDAIGADEVQERVASDPAALAELIGHRRTVLVVDQFEELFTLCRDDMARRHFVAALTASAGQSLHVLITLRADFYADVAEFPGLRSAVAEQQVYIGPMEPDELRRAIEAPARLGGWDIAPGLVDLLLRDVGDEPGALPLLSHALLETWRRRRGGRMTLKGYFESGEVRGAIARTADSLYAGLPREEQQATREILLRLTDLGEGTQDTRRRAPLDELVPHATAKAAEQTTDVLQRLIEARLVTVDEGTAEVAHEALIREWPLLREWLREDREGLRLQRQITEISAEWQSLNREPSLLYRGARLAVAREWVDAHPRALTAREQAFVDASIEAEDRAENERAEQQQREIQAAQRAADAERLRAAEQEAANRRLRRRAIFLAGAVILAGGLGITAFVFAGQASERATQAQAEAARADEQRRTALSRQLAAQSDTSLRQLDLSLLLSVEALNAADTVEARASLLQALLSEPRLVGFLGSGGGDMVFAEDGGMLASLNADGTVTLWDMDTRTRVTELSSEGFVPFSIALSRDGKLLAAGGVEGEVVVWEVATGQPIGSRLVGHEGLVTSVAFAPDGETLYSSGFYDRSIIRWDVANGDPIGKPLTGNQSPIIAIALSPDGTRLASGSNNDLLLWDIKHMRVLRRLRGPESELVHGGFSPGATSAVSFSPDGQTLAASDGIAIFLWDVETGASIANWRANAGGFVGPTISSPESGSNIAFSADGRLLAFGRSDGTIGVWDVASHTLIGEPLLASPSGVGRVAFSPTGNQLASAAGGNIALWKLEPQERISRRLHHEGAASSVAFSPDGATLAVSSSDGEGEGDGTLSFWDVAQGDQRFAIDTSPKSEMVFGRDGRLIATNVEGNIGQWDPSVGRRLAQPFDAGKLYEEWPLLALSADSRIVVSAQGCCEGSEIKVWDLDRRAAATLAPETRGAGVTSLALTADGQRLAAGYGEGAVTIWDVTRRRLIADLETDYDTFIDSVAFSSDGGLLATSGEGSIVVFDVATRAPTGAALIEHTAPVLELAFTPDNRLLASVGADGSMILWDLQAGQSIGTLGAGVRGMAFSPDGLTLAASGDEGTVLWDIGTDAWREAACRLANRNLTAEEWRRFLGDEEYRPTCPDL